jgi:hypothetical protein
MEHMRQIAYETVLRACSFASLGIFCVMTGMSFDPRLAFQAGGFLTTIMAFILILKAREALTKDYRRTEMWLYLEKDRRPPDSYAQWASSTILRETYLNFAKWTAMISIVMWGLTLILSLLGTKSTYSLDSDSPSKSHFLPPSEVSEGARTGHVDKPVPSIRYQTLP